MTEQQVAIINRWAWVLSPCVEFACRYLQLPKVEIGFADCPGKSRGTKLALSYAKSKGKPIISLAADKGDCYGILRSK